MTDTDTLAGLDLLESLSPPTCEALPAAPQPADPDRMTIVDLRLTEVCGQEAVAALTGRCPGCHRTATPTYLCGSHAAIFARWLARITQSGARFRCDCGTVAGPAFYYRLVML